jgi:hypothetical protein
VSESAGPAIAVASLRSLAAIAFRATGPREGDKIDGRQITTKRRNAKLDLLKCRPALRQPPQGRFAVPRWIFGSWGRRGRTPIAPDNPDL